MLEPECHYLNHGSYGAVARPVFEAADQIRRDIEWQPGAFMQTKVFDRVRQAAGTLGEFVGARGENLVFVDNATTAVNAVLRSLTLMPGDEVLTTSHVYNAVRKTLEFVTERASARLVVADIPYPVHAIADVVDIVTASMSGRTRLVVLDHVTSETALVLPVREIVEYARDRGIPVLIDGAHAPGMLRLSLEDLGATFYAGNCHKWLGSPRGCGFLWTDPDAQRRVRPTAISHFINDGYTRAFDWPGTRDFTPWLAVEPAIAFRHSLGEGNIYAYCRPLAARAVRHLVDVWGTETGTPRSAMSFMATVALPWDGPATADHADTVRRILRDRYNTECFVKAFEDRLWLRVSAYVYNDFEDYARLGEIMPDVLADL